MVIALDPLQENDYICKADRDLPEEDQTVWKIKPLSAKEKMVLEDKYMLASASAKEGDQVETSFDIKIHRRNYDALNIGLVGWENLNDSEGNPVKFQKTKIRNAAGFSDALLSRIPAAIRAELAEVCLEGFDAEAERD